MRNLIRPLEDLEQMELRARQRPGAFLLRHGRIHQGRRKHWTQAHIRWLEAREFDGSAQQVVLLAYLDMMTGAQERIVQLAAQIPEAAT